MKRMEKLESRVLMAARPEVSGLDRFYLQLTADFAAECSLDEVARPQVLEIHRPCPQVAKIEKRVSLKREQAGALALLKTI